MAFPAAGLIFSIMILFLIHIDMCGEFRGFVRECPGLPVTLVIIQRIHVHHGRQRGSATEQNAVKHHTGIDTVVVTKISDLRQPHPGGRAKRLTVNTGNQSLHNLINTGPVSRQATTIASSSC